MSEADGPLIIQISASWPPRVCGIADYTAHLCRALRECGANVEAWTGRGETAPLPGVRPVAGAWDSAGVRALVREIAAARPRLVHLQYERSLYEQQAAVPLLLPRLLRSAGIPLVTTFHSLDGPTGWKKAHRLALVPLLRGSASVVVCSERQHRALARVPGLAKKTALIPVGNVIPVVQTRPLDKPLDGPLRLVYFGFVWRGRNIETLLHTLHAVQASGQPAVLDLVGGLRDSEYRAELENLADELGVGDSVHWCGALPAPNVSAALARADIVLLPFASGVSTGRTTLMAALAHHAPLVAMATADNLSPLFRDGENMALAPAGDEAAFIRQTVALAHDVPLRARLARGASALALALSWPAIARATLDLPAYRGIIAP